MNTEKDSERKRLAYARKKEIQTKNVKLAQPIFCLLNTGGLRSSIGKGTVSLGDIYKLMPFDNTIVCYDTT